MNGKTVGNHHFHPLKDGCSYCSEFQGLVVVSDRRTQQIIAYWNSNGVRIQTPPVLNAGKFGDFQPFVKYTAEI